jgi:hypothetical protein
MWRQTAVAVLALAVGLVVYRAAVASVSGSVFYGGSSGPCEQATCSTQWVFDGVTGFPIGMVETHASSDPNRAGSFESPPDADLENHWLFSIFVGLAFPASALFG